MRKNQKAEIRKPEILENYYQVIIREGLEGASIGKIAKRMNIHPSLIIHYFKTKEKMTIELVDLMIEKYEAPEFLNFSHVSDLNQRFHLLMDTLFSFEWSRTVNPGVHFGFYYLSFRNSEIRKKFREMFKRFKSYLVEELSLYLSAGIICNTDVEGAADMIVTLMEGLEFHANFLCDGRPFESFAGASKQIVLDLLMHSAENLQ
ncbi:MAG: TetR family transcriptional regulator [Deltaproteobacteria bacterium]